MGICIPVQVSKVNKPAATSTQLPGPKNAQKSVLNMLDAQSDPDDIYSDRDDEIMAMAEEEEEEEEEGGGGGNGEEEEEESSQEEEDEDEEDKPPKIPQKRKNSHGHGSKSM